MPNPLTADEVKLARKLRRQAITWAALARTLGRQHSVVRKQLDAEFKDHRSMLSANWVKKQRLMRSRSSGDIGLGSPVVKPHEGDLANRANVPLHVAADRDRRAQLEHASLTAALLGDPLPGRSALDRRGPRVVVRND